MKLKMDVVNTTNTSSIVYSLANYLTHSYKEMFDRADEIKDIPERREEFLTLFGAVEAWYDTMKALNYYIDYFEDIKNVGTE